MTNDMTRRYDIRNYGATELRNFGNGLKKYASGITCHANHVLRLAAVLLLMIGVQSAKATDYVLTYTNGGTTYYVGMNGNNIAVKTTFDPSCVWTCRNGNNDASLSNNNSYSLRNKVNNAYYLTTSCTRSGGIGNRVYTWDALNVQTSANNIWRSSNATSGNVYAYYSSGGIGAWNRSASIRVVNNAWAMYDNNTNGSQNYQVTSSQNILIDNTTAPAISVSSVSGNKIYLNHTNLDGSYVPANSFTGYMFNNTTHNYYNNTDYGSDVPDEVSVDVSSLSPTYTWSITGANASIDNNGVLTLSGTPTGNITVRLTVSNISPLANKTVDFTLTRAAVAQNSTSTTTLTTPTITPATKALEFGESQTFTAAVTATTTTSTVAAHTTLTGGGNTYYYYDNALHNAAPSATNVETHPEPTYSWSLTGAAATGGNLTPTSGSGSTINITYGTASSNNANATLTVTASATGATNKTATATITANRTMPTAITATPTSLSIPVGGSGQSTYTLTPAGAYDEVTATSSNTSVATVGRTGNTINVTGVSAGSAVITVSAARPGSTPVTTTITVTVKEVCVTPTITITPAAGGNTANVTLSTTTAGATIHYTTDGSDPSASSTAYSGSAFEIGNGETVKAIAVKEGCIDSEIASQTYTADKIATPTITITSSGVTFDCATSGVTFYYTTDGTTPTTSSTAWNGSPITGLSDGATIKVIADKAGMITSDAATTTYYPATVVSGGTVTINDYEDHRWTYYSGVDASVDGGNYNTNYNGKLYSPNPRNVKITYDGNGGEVSIDESETEFVYYKTLEQGTTAGQYPYTVISNPFSKRPDGKGFGGWKIISGGDYIQGHSNNDVLALDEDITFVNLPYPSVNCTSAEIEFQATWVNYNSKTNASGNTFTYSVSGGTYETNFLILNRNVTGTITISSPCTIMMVEPDGGNDYRNTYTFTGNITPNNNGVTKIEFTRWNSTNTLNCNNHSVTVGRGMTTTSQCASYVTGVTGRTQNNGLTTYNNSLNYHLKLESGKFTDVSFIAGTAGTAGYVNCNGTSNQIKGTLGNDYDRAKGDNTKLDIVDEIYLGYRPTYANGNQNNANFTCWVKSGNLCSGTNVTNTTFNNNGSPSGGYYGEASQCLYVSSAGSQTNIGKRKLYVEGGILAGIAGGIDSNNPADSESFFLRMTGGQVRGVVYGSGAFAASSGIRRFIITGGTINGWVAAGCNGTDPTQSGGTLPSDTYVYVGGDSHIGNTTDLTLNTSTDGNVFGAGSGNSAQATTGQVNNSNVVIADECYVKRNVYGGGNYGYSNATATVYVTGGEVAGSVFGGSNQKQGVTVNVNMTGGQVDSGVYGGSNVTGTISGSVTMNINGGQVGTSSATANIHGGGYGSATRVSQNVDITLGKTGQTEPGVTVYGDVYGGSALGYVNGTTAADTYHTYVTLNKGIINGSLYGGGLGAAGTAANVYGPVTVTVNGGSVKKTDANGANGSGGVYGANNINGAPQRSVTVDIYGTDPAPASDQYALYAVYGGGNAADYTYGNGYPTVTVHNCDNSIEYVYGGGNAAAVSATDVTIWGGNKIGNVFGGGNGTVTPANVNGNAVTKIYGGTIGSVFGGSNSRGSISGDISVTVQKQSGDTDPDGSSTACAMHIDEVYGGGNMAASQAGSITIGCTGDEGEGIGDVYGGANAANITGNIELNITGGSIERVFGGNNASGTISGTIQVNVNWKTTDPCGYNYLGSVFGGGNRAPYRGTPDVNIINGTVSHSVYGGGNEAGVDGGDVSMTGGTVLGGIYGGCNTSGTVDGDINVNVTGGTIGADYSTDATKKANVHGGGYGSDTETSGSVYVNINGSSVVIYGDVYGGSALGKVNPDTSEETQVTLTAGTIHGDAYGGGLGDASNAALVNGNVMVTQNGVVFVKATTTDDLGNTVVTAGRIFGCNNLNGSPRGTVLVLVNKTARADGNAHAKSVYDAAGNITTNNYEMAAVYGGGNLAAYNPSSPEANGQYDTGGHDNTKKPLQVVINGCNDVSIEYVYGGGNAAPTPATDVLILGSYEIGYVFGGGNGKDKYSLDGGTTWTANPGADVGLKPLETGGTPYEGDNTKQVYGTGEALACLLGGTIHYAFGGSNTKGNVREEGKVYLDENGSTCPLVIDEVYGGGNEAYMEGDTRIELGCISYLKEIYGGARAANLGGDIVLTITSGTFDRVFGGNNLSGTINGSITVNIEETGCHPVIIGELYGCGNLAPYTTPGGKTDPTINVKSFTSIGRIFGGGLGGTPTVSNPNPAEVTGNTIVNINEVKGKYAGNTYAGETKTIGGTSVILPAHAADAIGAIGTVFGGGNAAKISGNTNVNIGTLEYIPVTIPIGDSVTGLYTRSGAGTDASPYVYTELTSVSAVAVASTTYYKPVVGANITGNVFGGGNQAEVTGNTNVEIGAEKVTAP